MKHLNIDRLRASDMRNTPFQYTVVPQFIDPGNLADIVADYPDLKGGSYPLETVAVTPTLQEVLEEMDSPEFEQAVAEKFNVDIVGRPKMYSLRGYCRSTDGKIHTDSKDKIVTVLLYLNTDWQHEGGKLRMLRSGTNLEDYVEEVAPDNGTLLIFRRSDNSWHGHGPFDGVRRSIQMNWMTTEGKRGFHALRHRLSAGLKKLRAA